MSTKSGGIIEIVGKEKLRNKQNNPFLLCFLLCNLLSAAELPVDTRDTVDYPPGDAVLIAAP